MMHRKVLLMILVSLLVLPSAAAVVVAQSSVNATIGVTPQSVQPGQRFNVTVDVSPGQYGISAGEVAVGFNQSVMKVVGVEAGGLLGPQPIFGLNETSNTAGTVRCAIARVGATSTPTPNATFVKIQFEVLGSAPAGSYPISLTAAFADADFANISSVAAQGGTVQIIMAQSVDYTLYIIFVVAAVAIIGGALVFLRRR